MSIAASEKLTEWISPSFKSLLAMTKRSENEANEKKQ